MKFAGILVLLVSLGAHAQDQLRLSFARQFPILAEEGWRQLRTENNSHDSLVLVQFIRPVKDTTWVAQVHRTLDGSIDKAFRMELIKTYVTDSAYHYLYYNKDRKLMFHYEFPRQGSYSYTFVSGKYYYDYFYGFLTDKQRNFFETHSDSLTRLPGNKLPPLPKEK